MRSVAPGRLRRLREELIDEGTGVIESTGDPDVVLEELDYALRPPRHERRTPTYGSIILPTTPVERWGDITGLHTELSPTATRDDHDVRRYADGLVSWTVRDADGIGALAVFDRAAGSERDLVIVSEATGGVIVQRRPDTGVRIVGSFGVARWDGSGWHVEPPFGSWFERASCGLADEESLILDRLLRFAVHDLGALGIGALFVFAGAHSNSQRWRVRRRVRGTHGDATTAATGSPDGPRPAAACAGADRRSGVHRRHRSAPSARRPAHSVGQSGRDSVTASGVPVTPRRVATAPTTPTPSWSS